MNLPLNERFTSVQKDDLKAALGKVVAEGEVLALSSFVAKALRDEMADDYNLTDEHVKRIVDTAAEAILTRDGLALSSDETEFGSASETIPAEREGPEGSGRVPALQIHAACVAIDSERVVVSTDARMVTVQPEKLVEGVLGQMLVSACLK